MKFIIKFIILTIALSLFIIYCNNGQFIQIHNPNDFQSTIIFMLVLVLLNSFLKPILKLLTFPLNCLTFGLFSLVINFIIVYFADKLVDSFSFTSLWNTFLFSIAFSLLGSIIDYFTKDND